MLSMNGVGENHPNKPQTKQNQNPESRSKKSAVLIYAIMHKCRLSIHHSMEQAAIGMVFIMENPLGALWLCRVSGHQHLCIRTHSCTERSNTTP